MTNLVEANANAYFGQLCEQLEEHRLYHAIGALCPCKQKWILVPNIPTFSNPTIKLDDIKSRRWRLIK